MHLGGPSKPHPLVYHYEDFASVLLKGLEALSEY